MSSEMVGQDPAGTALARAGLYSLLARLFATELEAGILARLRESGTNYFSLPDATEEESWLQARREEFSRLFLLNIFPYESIYTGTAVMLNSPETDAVRKFYRQHGYEHPGGLLADHLAAELDFMNFLAARNTAEEQDEIQERFSREHLLNWLPVFVLALNRERAGRFYRELAGLALSFVCQDYHYLTGSEDSPDSLETFLSPVLEEPDLKAIVHWLVTPVQAGFFLSKSDLFDLARRLNLPAGFSDRYKFLRGLFEAAARYEILPQLLDELSQIAGQASAGLAELQTEVENAEFFIWHPWLEKIGATISLLQRLKNNLATGLINRNFDDE